MRSLILFASILLPYLSLAQNGGGGGTNNNSPGFYNPSTVPVVYTGTATGSIIVPGRMLMRVNTDNFVLQFDNWEELANGKVYPGYLFLDIISNVPWVVKVRSLDPFLISSVSNTATNTPCSLVSL